LLAAVLEKVDSLVDLVNAFVGGKEAEEAAVVLDRFHGYSLLFF
jgi:hypothetical protein